MNIIQNCTSLFRKTVCKGDCSKVKAFLDNRDVVKPVYSSALCLAAQHKHHQVVELLLDHGADVNTKDYGGNAALHYSVELNDLVTAKLLLQRGADVGSQTNVLYIAVRKGLVEMVDILVEFGADINQSDQYGQTALHYAVLQDDAQVTNTKNDKVRNLCSVENIVRILLREGINVNAKTENGFTALHYAVSLSYSNVVAALLEHGANVLSYIDRHILPPKRAQLQRKMGVRRTCCKSNGVSSLTQCLTTLLHVVSESNNVTILIMLLDAGARVDAVDSDGRTPIIVAVWCRYHKVVEVLLKFGADVELSNKSGLTPLHLACLKGSNKVMKLLLRAGADINATSKNGLVPYQFLIRFIALCPDTFYGHFTSHKQKFMMLQTQINMMNVNKIKLIGFNRAVEARLRRRSSEAEVKAIENYSKSFRIDANTTLDSVLKDIDNPTYARNPMFECKLDKVQDDINKAFPSLGNVAKFFVKNARKRIGLLDDATNRFMILVERTYGKLRPLPAEVVEVILSFLSDHDLDHFTKSADICELNTEV